MRIAMMGFVQLRDPHGRYALLVNKGRLARDQGRILSPIGGGLEADKEGEGIKDLKKLGATDFEGERELRFRIPDDRIADVLKWYERQINREVSALREFREELGGEETGILTEEEMSMISERLIARRTYKAETKRDVPEKQTLYLIEVFKVGLHPHFFEKLQVAAAEPVERRWVHFVTPREFDAGETDDKVEIGPISHTIL